MTMRIDNVRSMLADMPVNVHAYTVKHDDWYTVIINARLSDDVQRDAFRHELIHIKNGDFDRDCDRTADSIEFTAHLYEELEDDREEEQTISGEGIYRA